MPSFSAKSNKRTKPEVDIESLGASDILMALQSWKDESEIIDTKLLLKSLREYRNGNFSVRLPEDKVGIAGEIARAFNESVELNQLLFKEFERVGKSVGRDGKLHQRVSISAARGHWALMVDAYNDTVAGMAEPIQELNRVVTAIAKGDLTEPMPLQREGKPLRGEFLSVAKTTNQLIDMLHKFSSEITQVAMDVGWDGILGRQVRIKGFSGVWLELISNVNCMSDNLTLQLRNIATVVTAVANGNLDQKITVNAQGEVRELKNTINTMVDRLTHFSSEVIRVVKEVDAEGKLGGQAEVRHLSGVWQELTSNVNGLASNLTGQVRNIASVAAAVANGDLTQKITVDAKGEILELKETINIMVGRLIQFSSEVTRVVQEVGTDGVLGGHAVVEDVAGVWHSLINNVNSMADNLTYQVRNIATVASAVAEGNLTQKITVDAKGEILELKNVINTMVDKLIKLASEVIRVTREVGTDGILGGHAVVGDVSGAWLELTNNVNGMADNLTNQVRNIATVATAVAQGDLTQKVTVEASGEFQSLKETINEMVDKLTRVSSEVIRVAEEVGTAGILGGQAEVAGVAGAWEDLTTSVNLLAENLAGQVRDIARVASAVASGDLSQKMTVDAEGEVLVLKETINSMTDTLSIFARQVTFVSREVGVEGKLGGQAAVPNAEGVWKALTENVNELAANLTLQIRAILSVVNDVTLGNLSGSIDVQAQGEIETLRNNVNQMIQTLKETSEINTKENWLKTNLSDFGRLMQGHKNFESLANVVITRLCPTVEAQHGVFYAFDRDASEIYEEAELVMLASYAFSKRKKVSNRFAMGQGLVGQVALEKKRILVQKIPDDYILLSSGLGEMKPVNVVVFPVIFESELVGVIELASFHPFTDIVLVFIDQLTISLGVVANAVKAGARTEILLKESQSLSEELTAQQQALKGTNQKLEIQAKTLKESETLLKNQQDELQQTNEELEEKSRVLTDQKLQVEDKNRQVEEGKAELEEKARQLAISSRYKSEFLANMSHELRTPLNSLMVLSDGLRKNIDKNLSEKQIEKMNTIHESGIELLELINEILDLAKIESGKMSIQIGDIFIQRLEGWALRGYQQMAENKRLNFKIDIDKDLPKTITTDEKRLQQILKNFLSNGIKFTKKGEVNLSIYIAQSGWSECLRHLNEAAMVVAFTVSDTGIGIAPKNHELVFEAFQQADGTTSRKYGGTGLGLSISREIARMLGGEITLQSEEGRGSSFTLYLPQTYIALEMDQENPLSSSGFLSAPTALSTPSPSALSSAAQLTRSSTHSALTHHNKEIVDTITIEPTQTDIDDDRVNIKPGDRTVVIIEDDLSFAKILLERARGQGFKAVVATRGDTGLFCVQEYKPDAIVLDIKLPVMNGWTVLDRIKHDTKIRHIPVHVISADNVMQRSLKQGAISCLQKPLTDDGLQHIFTQIEEFQKLKMRQLLVVEDDDNQRAAIIDLIGNGDVHTTAVATAEEALAVLQQQEFHCMVLDLNLPDMSGLDLIERIKLQPELVRLPIIIYTGKDLSEEEEIRLNFVAETIIVKDVRSPERLLDETALFLHRVEANLPESKRQMLFQVHENDPQLSGRKILIVDDDMRNIFTLTSVFEAHECTTFFAESGQQAIDTLKNHPDIEIVLMDIMMPEMDGYQTMQIIRSIKEFQYLPIIAVTAKAMREDRQKCLDAGASDYIMKPVNTEQLLSLVRVWLYKEIN